MEVAGEKIVVLKLARVKTKQALARPESHTL